LLSQTSQANEVTKSYDELEKSIELSSKTIKSEVIKEINLLKEVNDILDEIDMIRRVLSDQALIMRNILCWRRQKGANEARDVDYFHQPLERFTRLEESTKRVQKSVRRILIIVGHQLRNNLLIQLACRPSRYTAKGSNHRPSARELQTVNGSINLHNCHRSLCACAPQWSVMSMDTDIKGRLLYLSVNSYWPSQSENLTGISLLRGWYK
jgi:hypothetical protein